ncbi:MAG: hypothetical protein D6763_07595 [Alphaproteobacteria bacterium]|nr:MAG: hypothetical protein D6763_07595 [Alphaproteobacteria bacterium]
MLSAIHTSLAGLLSAGTRARDAADRIVQATARDAQVVDAATAAAGRRAYGEAVVLGGNGREPGPTKGYNAPVTSPAAASDPADELVHGLVDLSLATHAYKANTAALKTADETLGQLLDDLS